MTITPAPVAPRTIPEGRACRLDAREGLLRRRMVSALLFLGSLPCAAIAEESKKVTFQDHALPLLRQRCGSCHNADKKTAGLDVTTYAGIMAGGGSGEIIVPGDASGSTLFRVVNHDDEPTMPPDAPPIPEAERQILRAWIDGGVLENAGSVAVKAKKVEVAMAGPVTERPKVQPLPAHLPLEPVLRTPSLDACTSIATSPWAPLAAVSGQKQVLLYRTDSLDLAGVLPFPEGRPHVVRFSRGGGLVLAAGGVGATSGRVAVWNLRNGRRIRTLGEELDVVLAADVSPDQRLVVLGGPQRMVRVYSLETGEKLFEMKKHTDWVQSAAFSPDGVLLATSDRSGGVVIWEAATGRDYLVLNGHPSGVSTLAWRGDSNMLATGCDDGQIRLWELENGNQVKAWGAHGGGVASVTFTRDGRLASVGRDRVAKLWKADGAQERAFEALPDIGLAATFCDETGRLVAGDWTGQIAVWNAADGSRVGALEQNPPTLADRVAAAERGLQAAKEALVQIEKTAADAAARTAAAAADQSAATTARQVAIAASEEIQKRFDAAMAAVAAAKKAHADAVAASGPFEEAVKAAAAGVDAAMKALAEAGEDAAKKGPAEQSLATAKQALADHQAKASAHKSETDKLAAAAGEAEKRLAPLGPERDKAKLAIDAAVARLAQADAALAKARGEEQSLAAQVVERKGGAAAAAATHARWLSEVAFQGRFTFLTASLAERERELAAAEAEAAEAEARMRSQEEVRRGHEAARDAAKKQTESLAATIAGVEKESQDLAGRIAVRGGEITAAQQRIEQIVQSIAALDEAGKSLARGLATIPGDADLTASQSAVTSARTAKQAQLTEKQQEMTALTTERSSWEKSLAEKKVALDRTKQELAAATAAMQDAAKRVEGAAPAVDGAAKEVAERQAAVVERQKQVTAASAELDALQGVVADQVAAG
jgi:hypothetical protein